MLSALNAAAAAGAIDAAAEEYWKTVAASSSSTAANNANGKSKKRPRHNDVYSDVADHQFAASLRVQAFRPALAAVLRFGIAETYGAERSVAQSRKYLDFSIEIANKLCILLRKTEGGRGGVGGGGTADLPICIHFSSLLVKEMLFLYRNLGKEDLSRFILENLMHPFKKLSVMKVAAQAKLDKATIDALADTEAAEQGGNFNSMNLGYLYALISYPLAVEWARVLLSQQKILEAERKLRFALEYFVDNMSPCSFSAAASRQLATLLRMYVPIQVVLGAGYNAALYEQCLGGGGAVEDGGSSNTASACSTRQLRSFLASLESHYAPLAAAVQSGDLRQFNSEFAKHRGFYHQQKVESQLLQIGRRVCCYNLMRQTHGLIRNSPTLVGAETGNAGLFTVAGGKGLKLDAFDAVFKYCDEKLWDEDVISIIVELVSRRALRCYGSWEKQGLVFDEKKPFASVKEWVK
eukprot:g17168.t1